MSDDSRYMEIGPYRLNELENPLNVAGWLLAEARACLELDQLTGRAIYQTVAIALIAAAQTIYMEMIPKGKTL